MINNTFTFNEAFYLMYYENPDTKLGFMVWNSRDGVTPFIVHENGVEFQHTHWSMDRRPNADYVKKALWVKGQRIFRDITPDEGKRFAVNRIAQFKGTPYELIEGSEAYTEMVESLTAEFSKPGEPNMYLLKGDEPLPDLTKLYR